ncbi:NADH dehydrogenase 1 alpha subcomplex subunit 5 [Anopheles darlingi]|uniref:NADH dehydrogenase 1 alpha subcomplex subunit 5 n=2 Tax=Anopheles darlingi TaxID=43151 RepID=W5JFR1_ANODA|nr:NADH dehydrogenase 1 alpha subcomplex subunit 5 [Anopheles darlingi]
MRDVGKTSPNCQLCLKKKNKIGEFCVGTFCRMAGVIKKATGLTGLQVAKNPHHTLTALYNKILRAVSKMPQEAAYRRYTEQIVSQRAKIVATTPNVREIEQKINCGQVEELIVQAENELTLARKMLGWKPWEPLVKQAPASQWTWPPAKLPELK